MIRTKIDCEKCNKQISKSNFSRHVEACKGPKLKKIRGIDFNPNHGFLDGSREAWNKGLKSTEKMKESLRKTHYNKRHNTDFNKLGSYNKRKRIIEEQNNCCLKCKNSHWLDEIITFEIDHIDGNNKNNKRTNLRALCPNCHSQTPTWRGRHPNSHRFKKASVAEWLGTQPIIELK